MKKNTRRGLIYFRYILPIITPLIMLLLMCIPCYSFVSADGGLHKKISAFELISNAWDTVREYLFGTAEQVQVTADFAGTVFGIIIILFLLFAIGMASAIYTSVTAFRFFLGGCSESKSRILFITLVPNRVVLSIYYALILPLAFFPRILPLIYENVLHYHVKLICEPFDTVIITLALFVATIAVIFITARAESLAEMNVFVKYKKQDAEELQDEEYEEVFSEENAYEALDRRAREEQNEKILKLLNKMHDDQEK